MAYSILLVDDSSIIRKVLTKTIGLSGLPVNGILEATNGREALDTLEQNWVDIVFLDLNMPVMNGLEFLKALRAHPKLAETPVIVVSTEGSEVRQQEILDLNAKAFLRKPVSPEKIADTVKTILEGAA